MTISDLTYYPNSYLSPKLESRPIPSKGGNSVFALEAIAKDEVIVMWGGTIVTGETLETLTPREQSLSVQIEENLYLVPEKVGPADHVNHGCEPNAGMYGAIGLVAMRDIAPGEEVCYDYAMSDGSPYDEFDCSCGSDLCRKRITGDDWRDPILWERYKGYFSLYLQRRIFRLQSND